MLDTVQLHLVTLVTPATARAPGRALDPQTGEAAYVSSLQSMAAASMAVSANTSTKSLVTSRIRPGAADPAQGVHSTPRGVGVVRRDPLEGPISQRFHADITRKEIVAEVILARLNTRSRPHQHLHLPESVLDHQQPNPRRIRRNAVAEVRGVGRVIKDTDVADVVAMRISRENHHPEARVLKTALVRPASIMHVLSSKVTTGNCPKAEMLLLDITSTVEIPCSTHTAPNVHFQSACYQILEELEMIKKIMMIHA